MFLFYIMLSTRSTTYKQSDNDDINDNNQINTANAKTFYSVYKQNQSLVSYQQTSYLS